MTANLRVRCQVSETGTGFLSIADRSSEGESPSLHPVWGLDPQVKSQPVHGREAGLLRVQIAAFTRA